MSFLDFLYNGGWNALNNTVGSWQQWTPAWYNDDDTRQEAARRFRQDLGTGDELAWQEWNTYLTNQLLTYMNPLATQQTIQALTVTGAPEFKDAYAGVNPSLNRFDGQTLAPGKTADDYFRSKARWDAIENGFNVAVSHLLDSQIEDKSEFTDDNVLDPFESAKNWFGELTRLGRKYGLDENQKRLNRWQEQDYQNELMSLMSLAPNQQFAELGYGLIEQPRYTKDLTPTQLNLSPTVKKPSSPYSTAYNFQNPFLR